MADNSNNANDHNGDKNMAFETNPNVASLLQKKIQEAYDKGIAPPPKRKNIIPSLRNKRVAITLSPTLSNSSVITTPIEIGNDEVGDNIDAELSLSELQETNDNLYYRNHLRLLYDLKRQLENFQILITNH
ncbi:412_t:CDS:2 [Racocetra fulgida]|uniref:412_t:CDS:1 n=1 Tax=Racocetra fulgida TaxID=60492 RepID=A0A9N8WDC8_9GLOM|nr:412_t:CDS:2 [Racocetra fulgida]